MVVDLIFTVSGRVQIDMTRAYEDPWWEKYSKDLNLDNPDEFRQAIQAYVSAYLSREKILSNAPWTCGPSDIYGANIEVRNDGSNRSESRTEESRSAS